jgi:hypothetical protein
MYTADTVWALFCCCGCLGLLQLCFLLLSCDHHRAPRNRVMVDGGWTGFCCVVVVWWPSGLLVIWGGLPACFQLLFVGTAGALSCCVENNRLPCWIV